MAQWNLKEYVAESILMQTDSGEDLGWKHRSLIIHPSLSVGKLDYNSFATSCIIVLNNAG